MKTKEVKQWLYGAMAVIGFVLVFGACGGFERETLEWWQALLVGGAGLLAGLYGLYKGKDGE